MKITVRESFNERLLRQINYIAKDNPQAARKLQKDIYKEINAIPDRVYSFRKSIHFKDENIRDLIFKGYTVVFKISEDTIDVFGFIKHQQFPTDE